MMNMSECGLCPRGCKVDRKTGQTGYCGQNSDIYIARAALHMWEEPCISGVNGSGTVFFSGCPLRCVFCQNRKIALGTVGNKISVGRLSEIFLELQEKGAHNINLVTPTHYVPQIIEALTKSKNEGLNIPIVYNTGSYENVDTIKSLEGLIDIYLPDLKYMSSDLSKLYSNAPDYFEVATKVIDEMVRQVGEPEFLGDMLTRGVVVRHMILPGSTKDSKSIIKYLLETYGEKIFISIMNQYTPMEGLGNYPNLTRKVTKREYDKVVDYAILLGLENGFIQEGETAKDSFIPDFENGIGVEKNV